MQDDFASRYLFEKPVWMARLARSESASQVIDVVHEFTRQHGELWSSLPIDCQPPPFTTADDVSRYAFALYQKELRYDRRVGQDVRALASFFTEAAHRVALVMAAASPLARRPFFDRQAD